MAKKLTLSKTDKPRVEDDTVDVTQALEAAARVEAAFDASMRELTRAQFDELICDATQLGDEETVWEAEAWLATNGEGAFASEPEAVIETADDKWLRGVKNAQTRLGAFHLSPTARLILDRSCENVAGNKGFSPRPESRGDEREREEQQRLNTLERAALFTAYRADLIDVLECAAAVNSVETLPGVVYSTCFAVQKAANFVANQMYRRALDKAGGEAPAPSTADRGHLVRTEYGEFAADQREEARSAPYGLGAEGEELRFTDGKGRVEHEDTSLSEHARILEAYGDVHVYLQLLTELHGWDVDAPMPYAYTNNPDGTFTPIWGAEQTLDMMEVRSKASATKRIVRQTQQMSAMLAHARATVLKAGRRAA